MLTRYDRQTIFTAAAFIAVLLKDNGSLQDSTESRIKKFANLLGQFCDEKLYTITKIQEQAFENEPVAHAIDALCDRYIKERREDESTDLPKDYETLMQMYARLQFRKILRQNEVLFSEITPQRLEEFVVHQIDGEIEHMKETRGAL